MLLNLRLNPKAASRLGNLQGAWVTVTNTRTGETYAGILCGYGTAMEKAMVNVKTGISFFSRKTYQRVTLCLENGECYMVQGTTVYVDSETPAISLV